MDAQTALVFVTIIAGSVITGVGSAMLWFRKKDEAITKRHEAFKEEIGKRDEAFKQDTATRFEKVWYGVHLVEGSHANVLADVRVLSEKVNNNVERIDNIWEVTKEIRDKVDNMNDTFTSVLIELRNGRERH